MELVSIFKPSILEYKDYGYSKPIKYTEEFLKSIADETHTVLLNEEHTSKVIGSLSDFTYEDGVLKCAVSDGVDVKDKGISPKFEFDLLEFEDYYEAVNGVLVDAGLTVSPRSHIVCNSIKEGVNVSDEVLQRTMERNEKLERELAKKDNQIMEMQKKLESVGELEEAIVSLKKDNDKFSKDYDVLKDKAKAYDEAIANKKAKLIETVASGDEERQKQLENIGYDDLKIMFDTWSKNSKPMGVGSSNDVEGEPSSNQNGDENESIEDVESLYESIFGKKVANSYE